jgi:hypothetical protein
MEDVLEAEAAHVTGIEELRSDQGRTTPNKACPNKKGSKLE